MWHHVERMTHCRIKKHPPQTKRGGCFFVFGKNFNLMTLPVQPAGRENHAENEYNNRCDELAVSEWKKLK